MIDLTFSNLNALRSTLAGFAENVAELRAARERVQSVPPHTEDIIDAYLAGVATVVQDHENLVASFGNDPQLPEAAEVIRNGAAIYFMRDLMASKVRELVTRICPEAKDGMKSSERKKTLRELDETLSRIREKREELRQGLSDEQAKLRELRQEAIWQRDWKAQTTIEREQRELAEEIANLCRDQDALLGLTTNMEGRS